MFSPAPFHSIPQLFFQNFKLECLIFETVRILSWQSFHLFNNIVSFTLLCTWWHIHYVQLQEVSKIGTFLYILWYFNENRSFWMVIYCKNNAWQRIMQFTVYKSTYGSRTKCVKVPLWQHCCWSHWSIQPNLNIGPVDLDALLIYPEIRWTYVGY